MMVTPKTYFKWPNLPDYIKMLIDSSETCATKFL